MPHYRFAKAELQRKQEEYNARLKDQAKDLQKTSTEGIQVLADLPVIPYLTQKGKVNDPGSHEKVTSKVMYLRYRQQHAKIPTLSDICCHIPNQVKASVYAIYDQDSVVQYIGVSRNVAQSLRLHLARHPDKTYSFKVFHITKPNRVILEVTRDAWIEELGNRPLVCMYRCVGSYVIDTDMTLAVMRLHID